MFDFAAGVGLDGISPWVFALWLAGWLALIYGVARLVTYLRAKRRNPERHPRTGR